MREAIYFLSDLHLGARYFANPVEAERRVVRFLNSIRNDAKAIYLLGDVLDYWFEYKEVVPRGHVRFFGALAALADAGVEITWLTGNHDIWLFDYLKKEIGIRVIDGSLVESINGRKFYLAHGDHEGNTSRKFRFIQRFFRNKLCQKLFAVIHPDLTVPLAMAWSGNSRKAGIQLNINTPQSSRAFEKLCSFAAQYNAQLPQCRKIDFFLFGHLHIVAQKKIANGAEVIELGDWLNNYSYARYASGKLSILYWLD